MQNDLFKDLKVVELASVLAGPSVGLFFAEMGAEVIKVENPKTQGDVTRSWRLPSEMSTGTSAYYASVNSGKKVVFKDLSKPADLNDVYRLLADADVVIVNFKQGDALKFGLDYGRVKTICPTIIYAEIKGFKSDPSRVAYDVVIQAETGWMSINGEPGGAPLKMPVALMDVLAGHQLKEGVLAALWHKEKSGKGSQVTVTLEETGIAALTNQAANYLHAHHVPQQMGSLHPNIAPYGEVMTCKEGKQLVLAVGSDAQFEKLMTLLGHPKAEWEGDFKTNQERVKLRSELGALLAPLFARVIRDAFLTECIDAGVPAGAVKTIDEVFASETAIQMIKDDKLLSAKSVLGNVFTIR